MATSRTAALLALGLATACGEDRVDHDYDTSVASPACADEHPRLAFDEGHHEHHTARGTYRPFVELARNDGYDVDRFDDPIDAGRLARYRVLAIACAMGENETGDASAF